MVIFITIAFSAFIFPVSATVIIGHRGACGYKVENTLTSFLHAITYGVDIVELDVFRCASGELVVFHDAKVDYITDGTGYIYHKTFDQIKMLNLAEQEKIPQLSEVFDIVNRQAKICIELKGFGAAYSTVQLIEHYVHTKDWQYSDFLVAAFDHIQLLEVKTYNSSIATVALICGIPVMFGQYAVDARADIASVYTDAISQEFIDDIHKRGLLVHVYTVNDYDDIKTMLMLGVDGIVTDYPDRVKYAISLLDASYIMQ